MRCFLMRIDVSPRCLAPALFAVAGFFTNLPAVGSASLLEPFGLAGRHVTSLGMHGSLYAGTIDDGVFRRDLSNPQASWVSLGLPGKRIRAVYPHTSGPLGFTTSAGLEGNAPHLDSALVYCSEMDQLPWVESDDGMTRNDIISV
ncbi:MAG: hypothetical protein OEN01_13025, partial [Candidatus Krumholzibacteria bacterium]|nr:hypothetical protein [Candidatus Krumholzibacteria bacterium]